MILVPRQIQMTGMTGNVAYYGGRFTPRQAYAAAHPPPRPPDETRRRTQDQTQDQTQDREAALRQLLDDGVITETEYDELKSRIAR